VGIGLDVCLQAIAAAGYREISYLARAPGATRATWQRATLDAVRPRS
jgi:hypothetical protein